MIDPVLKPLVAEKFGFAQAQHLLQRAGFGGTQDEIRTLADWGLRKAVEHLVTVSSDTTTESVNADLFDGTIMRSLTREEQAALRQARRNNNTEVLDAFRKQRMENQQKDRKQIREIKKWWLTRIIETKQPLVEKMTLFYHGHFATGYRKIENSYHMFMQNQLFRNHAVGNFADLCFGIIRDPAMLAYLDNNDSNMNHPNENLAREFMELFTLGEGIAYTENDIKQGAKALTGYTFENNDFIYREGQHDKSSKLILGQRGAFSGDDFVRIILSRSECAEFICYKLYKYFVADMVNGADKVQIRFIQALAKLMVQSKYDMQPVLQTLFSSAHFYDPEYGVGTQIKSPVQLVVQAIRTLNTPVVKLDTLVEALGLMDQDLFMPPSVKGWDGGRSWINSSTIFLRHNILLHLLTGKMPGGYSSMGKRTKFDAMALIMDLRSVSGGYDPVVTISYLLRVCLPVTVVEENRERYTAILADFVAKNGGIINAEIVTGLLCLITAMPEYQLC